MAMILDYAPGMSLTDPWVWTTTRNGIAYRTTQAGTVAQVAANVLRDNHYIGGVRTTLLEVASINSLLQSQALATTPWGSNKLTVTNNAAVAPDGTTTATSLITTAVTAADFFTQQQQTITSAENVSASGFFKAKGYTGLQFRCQDAGSTNGFRIAVDLITGVITPVANFGGGLITGSVAVPLANGWFWVGIWGTINGGVVAGGPMALVYDTSAHAATSTAYLADGASGILAWGLQLERWGATIKGVPTSYMPTTTLTASRPFDVLTTPWWPQTQPTWLYMKHIDIGLAQRNIVGASAFDNPVFFADAALDYPRWRVMWGNSGPQTISEVRASPLYLSDSVAGGIAPTVTPWSSSVETFCRWFADNHVETQCSVNGGAVVTGADSGGIGEFFDLNAATPVLLQLRSPQVGLTRLKIGAGTAPITTLALAAAA